MFSGLTEREVNDELALKEDIIKWMVKHQLKDTDKIGLVVGEYYTNEDKIVEAVKKNKKPDELIGQ